MLQKAARLGVAAEIVDSVMDDLDITVSPFGLDGPLAASLYRHRSGLSLADRGYASPWPGTSVEPGLHH